MLHLKRALGSLIVAVTLVAIVFAQASTGLAMPMPGDGAPTAMDVSTNTGNATMTIPIPVPLGTGGFEPELRLTYSSFEGDGPFGVGWALEFGEIRRSIRFGIPSFNDGTDQFELGGQLLVTNPSESNANQTRYHTATETFRRIYHVHNGSQDYWEVTQPDGTKLRYGQIDPQRVRKDGTTGPIFRWLLGSMEDPYGNIIAFTHRVENGEAYPLRVDYTYRGFPPVAVGTLRTVDFIYEERPDPSLTFMGGVRRKITLRADRIEVHTGPTTTDATLFRRVQFTYAGEPGAGKAYRTNRSRLVRAQFVGAGGTEALPPQTFEYRDPADDPATTGNGGHWTTQNVAVPPGLSLSALRVAEVNGDGFPDLLYALVDTQGTTTRAVYLGTGNGWNTSADSGWTAALGAVTGSSAKVRVQGITVSSSVPQTRACRDAAIPSPQTVPFMTNVVFSNATSPAENGIGYPPANQLSDHELAPSWQAMDLNGDNLVDLVQSNHVGESVTDYTCSSSSQVAPVYTPGTTRGDVWLNNGSGWTRDASLSATLPPFSIVVVNGGIRRYGLDPRFVDLDADGRTDLIVMQFTVMNGGDKRVYQARAYRNTPGGWVATPALDPPTSHALLEGDERGSFVFRTLNRSVEFADLNRDGLSDLIKTAMPVPLTSSCFDENFTQSGVWLNAGSGWCSGETGAMCSGAKSQYLPPVSFRRGSYRDFFNLTCEATSQAVAFKDLNDDGLLDLLRTDGTRNSQGQPIADGRKAWIQSPQASGQSVWIEDAQFMPPLATIDGPGTSPASGPIFETGVVSADFDANSTDDLVKLPGTPAGVGSAAGRVRFSDLLSRVQNGRGGTVEYGYESAAKQQDGLFNLTAAILISDGQGTVRFNTSPVVSSLRKSGVDVNTSSQDFRYALPRFHVGDRMSLGFAGVSVTLGVSKFSQFFDQRKGAAGRIRVAIEGTACSELSRTVNTYEILPGNHPEVGQGSTALALVGRLTGDTTQRSYGVGTGCGGSGETVGSSVVRSFEYDPKNGDPFRGYNFVTRITTSRRTNTLVETRRLRVPDLTRWIVGLVDGTLVTSSAGELAKSSIVYRNEGRPQDVIFYDGPRGNLTAALPRTRTFTYDAFGNMRSMTDPGGHKTEFCFDGDTTFEGGTSCSSPTTESTHSVRVGIRDPLLQVTTMRPDPTTGLITETVRVYSSERQKSEFDAFGRLKRTSFQPVGQSYIVLSEFDYFDLNVDPAAPQEHVVKRARTQTGSSASVRTAIYLDGFGEEVRTVEEGPIVSGTIGYFGATKKRDPTTLQTVTTLPESCGSDPHCLGIGGPSQPRIVETTDAIGRRVQLQTPSGVEKFDYRRIVDTHPDTGSQSLDAVLAMDPRGYLTQRIFDGDLLTWVEECGGAPFANPSEASLSGVSCTSPARTFHRYEATGELRATYDALATSLSDPNKATLRFVYDSVGRVLQTYDVNKTAPVINSYNASGLLEQQTNARGQAILFTYDALDRPKTTSYPLGGGVTQTYTLEYDARTRKIEYVYQTNSSSPSAPVFVKGMTYDSLGRPFRETVRYKTNPILVTETVVDLLGRATRIRYPDLSTEVGYEYEGAYLKRVCELGTAENCSSGGAIPYLSDVGYDTVGRATALQGFNSQENPYAPTLRFTYNSGTSRLDRLKLDTIFEGSGVAETLDLNYLYDNDDNVTQVTDGSYQFDGSADISFSVEYTYDARNRLASRKRGGQTRHFRYDVVGNMTGKAVVNQTDTNQAYDSARRHRVVQAAGMTYTYDADGNVSQRGAQQLTFDALNRLACIAASSAPCDSYSYDFDGIRVAGGGQATPLRVFAGQLFEWEPTTNKGTARIYAMGRQIAYKKIGTVTLRTGVDIHGFPIDRIVPPLVGALMAAAFAALLAVLIRWGLLRGLAERPAYSGVVLGAATLLAFPPQVWAGFSTPPGQGTYRRWVWEDPLGSSVHITDQDGLVVHQRAFAPFGEIEAQRMSEPTDRTFAMHGFEGQFELYYMKQRWYDPASGRFLSTDPIVRSIGAPQSLNAYSYVENNPINRFDPTGTQADSPPQGPNPYQPPSSPIGPEGPSTLGRVGRALGSGLVGILIEGAVESVNKNLEPSVVRGSILTVLGTLETANGVFVIVQGTAVTGAGIATLLAPGIVNKPAGVVIILVGAGVVWAGFEEGASGSSRSQIGLREIQAFTDNETVKDFGRAFEIAFASLQVFFELLATEEALGNISVVGPERKRGESQREVTVRAE